MMMMQGDDCVVKIVMHGDWLDGDNGGRIPVQMMHDDDAL